MVSTRAVLSMGPNKCSGPSNSSVDGSKRPRAKGVKQGVALSGPGGFPWGSCYQPIKGRGPNAKSPVKCLNDSRAKPKLHSHVSGLWTFWEANIRIVLANPLKWDNVNPCPVKQVGQRTPLGLTLKRQPIKQTWKTVPLYGQWVGLLTFNVLGKKTCASPLTSKSSQIPGPNVL